MAILIDNSRAFTTSKRLVDDLKGIDRELWERFETLDETALSDAIGEWLSDGWERRVNSASPKKGQPRCSLAPRCLQMSRRRTPSCQTLAQTTVDDADMLPDLLSQVEAPMRRVTGDGAYDTRSVCTAVGEAGGPSVEIVVPPRRRALALPTATGPWKQRTEHVERISAIGRPMGHNAHAGGVNSKE